MAGEAVTVRKLDPNGVETWRYDGLILERGEHHVRLEAYFNRQDLPFHGIVIRQGDRFVETFYTQRWYNIFEIHDRDDDGIKAWYCNIGYPATITADEVSYRDLALDLLIYADGQQLVLDEKEFNRLNLSEADRKQALQALDELQGLFRQGR